MKWILALFALTPISVSAQSSYPQVTLSGVAYYLVDGDSSTGEQFLSMDGYCKLNGGSYASYWSSAPFQVENLVALDENGSPLHYYPNNDLGNLSVILDIGCE